MPSTITRPLFSLFPALEKKIPLASVATLPTPITRVDALASELGIGRLVVKRDDLTGETYGGNKVRKLEFLIGQAERRGARALVTFGFAGSNHALATAIYARERGLRAVSMLMPQPNARYVRRNLLAGHAAEADLRLYPTQRRLAAALPVVLGRYTLQTGRRPMIIPPGGSSTVGILGFVNAALELKQQIDAGDLPTPDRIYLPLGSMGSAAGLLVGLGIAGVDTDVVGVQVAPGHYVNRERLQRMVEAVVQYLCARDDSIPISRDVLARFTLRTDQFGEGYARFTAAGNDAIRTLRDAADLPLEGTYSGKAFAALLADGKAGELREKQVLFWLTHNSRDFARTLTPDYRALPRRFHRFFTQDVQDSQ